MLKPPMEVQVAISNLQGTPEMNNVLTWLESEMKAAEDTYVNTDRRDNLPVHQNSVRILRQLVNVFRGR